MWNFSWRLRRPEVAMNGYQVKGEVGRLLPETIFLDSIPFPAREMEERGIK